MAETVLAKMAVQIAANTAEFNKSISRTESNFKKFSSSILKIGASIGLVFGAREVASFTFEVAKLAGEADGVRAAFEKLPESAKLMNDLKDATAGTVSELDLMKRSVQAANFGIALESLPQLLQFAAIRAQQTGQSVDYLVDSIITGIGRKSPLILDNLGISAVRLKEQFNGASLEAQNIGDVAKAVGRIAGEELQKMGNFSENTSTKVQRLSASWDNFKVAIGNAVNQSGVLQRVLDGITDTLTVTSTEQTAALNGVLDQLNSGQIDAENYGAALKFAQTQAKNLGVSLLVLTDELTGLRKVLIDPRSKIKIVDPEDAKEQIVTLKTLQAKLKDLNDQFSETDTVDKKKLSNIGNEIIKTQSLIEELEKYRKKQKEVNDLRKVDPIQKVGGLLKIAQEFNKIQDEAKRAAEEIGRFFLTLNPVSQLPEKLLPTESMRKAFEEAKKVVKEGTEGIQKQLIDVTPLISNGIAGIADALGNALGSGNFKNFGRGLLEAVASFAQQLGALMIASGIAQQVLKSGNPVAMVVAGAALVAAGAAIKAVLSRQSKLPNASTGGGSGGYSGSSSRGVSNAEVGRPIYNIAGVIRGEDLYIVLKNYEKGKLNG